MLQKQPETYTELTEAETAFLQMAIRLLRVACAAVILSTTSAAASDQPPGWSAYHPRAPRCPERFVKALSAWGDTLAHLALAEDEIIQRIDQQDSALHSALHSSFGQVRERLEGQMPTPKVPCVMYTPHGHGIYLCDKNGCSGIF